MSGKLYVMVGLSASGKSSITREIAAKEHALIISTDAIRGELSGGNITDQSRNVEVFQIFNQRIRDGLRAGKTVIADATELTMKARRGLLSSVGRFAKTVCTCIVVKPVEECIRDNKQRKFPVPEKVIRHQLEGFQIPFYEEGFDEIKIYWASKGKEDNRSLSSFISNCMRKMDGFDQKNPYHTMPLGEHSRFTAYLFRKKGYGELLYKAALLHDIGKLYTQQIDGKGVAHYISHDSVGTYYLLCHMPTKDFKDTEQLLDFLFLVNYHMLPFGWEKSKTMSKWEKRLGSDKTKLLLDFHECDCARE